MKIKMKTEPLVAWQWLLSIVVFGSVADITLTRYQQFKDFQKRILVATNLFGRDFLLCVDIYFKILL
jgi:hypothetical protein